MLYLRTRRRHAFAPHLARHTMVLGARPDMATCDGRPLHPLAKNVPMLKCKDDMKSTVNVAKLRHQAFIHMVDKLAKYPHFITRVHDVVFSDDFQIPGSLDLSVDKWEGEVKSLAKIPVGWMANFLLRQYAPGGLTKNHLEALATNDEVNIPELFSFSLQLPLKTELPPEVQAIPLLAYQLLEKRAKAVGDRVAHLITKGGVKSDGLEFGTGVLLVGVRRRQPGAQSRALRRRT